MSAEAAVVTGDRAVARALQTYPGRPEARPFSPEEVQPPGPFRMYSATAIEHWVLAKDGQPDHRIPVHP
jgi:hypothetical protein